MTSVTIAPTSGPEGPPASARRVRSASGGADRVFALSLRSVGLAVLLIMGGVGLFLFFQGSGAVADAGLKFLTTQAWEPDSHNFGIATVLTGTLLIAAVAVILAVPLATGVALYISEYAPRALRRRLINMVDLMAAVPGVGYGLWGFYLLNQQVIPLARWISSTLGWIPFLASPTPTPTTRWSPRPATSPRRSSRGSWCRW